MRRKIHDYPNISVNADSLPASMDFAQLFRRLAPLHIEIGSGKGTFLVNQAKAFPGINFFGIEWANKYYRYSVDRIARHSLQNVRIIRTDAAQFIRENVPNACVDCFHIYFPDPWPKKRHHKRRLINPENLDQMTRCLKTEGIINIATDHQEYYQWIIQALRSRSDQLTETEYTRPAGSEGEELAGTNFERKYLREGRKVYTAAVKKIKTGSNC